LHNILIQFGTPIKLVRLIKMCLNETYSTVRVCKNLFDMFPVKNSLKQGDALSTFLFNFALDHAITGVKVNENSLKLNVTRTLLVYADEVNMLGGNVLYIL